MASNAQYSALEHGGLELAAGTDNGAEVAHHTEKEGTAPEVVQRSSLDMPEALHPSDVKDPPAYDTKGKDGFVGAVPLQPDGADGFHSGEKGNVAYAGERRILRMKRRTFIIVMVILAIVVIGAVVGGAVGGVISRNNRENDQSESGDPAIGENAAGTAALVAPDNDDLLVTYFQYYDSEILENVFDGSWSLDDNDEEASTVTDMAGVGSAIAAISYISYGTLHRQVFFFTSHGILMETNTTSFNGSMAMNWTDPVQISSQASSASGVGLTACANNETGGLNGVRVYFGLAIGGIQEVGYDFSKPASGWTQWQYWDGNVNAADANSGVACTSSSTDAGSIGNVYFRNSTTGLVQNVYYNYSSASGWYPGASSSRPALIGTDIAACNDGDQSEYVFYQANDTNGIVRADTTIVGGHFSEIEDQISSIDTKTKLSAAYYWDGAAFLYQNSTAPAYIYLQDNARGGSAVLEETIDYA